MTKRKKNTATEAFNLLFGEEGVPVIAPVIEREVARNAGATNCYLVVMTGKSGTKINDLYDTSIWNEGKEIKLTGKHRLQGAYLRSITEALKQEGVKGTMSIFNHTVEDADELINEHQKMLIKLAKGVDWKVMAKVHIQEEELNEVIGTLQNEYFDKEIESGRITGTRKGFRFTEYEAKKATLRYREANELHNALRSRFKQGQADYIAYKIRKYIELL
jgi:hypothetical protein